MTPGNRLQLQRGLSVRLFAGARTRIAIGALPPIARIVHDPPGYLPDVLRHFSKPTDASEAVANLSTRLGVSDGALRAAIADLVRAGILTEPGDNGDRYDRHHLYCELLGVSVETYRAGVRDRTVGVIGAGGLGSSVAMHLAAAGVGRIVISDGDRLEATNLTRSVLYRDRSIGELKVEAAAAELRALNPDIQLRSVPRPFSGPELIQDHFSDCDFLVLTADRPREVHDWVDVAARRLGIGYINAGYIETHASVGPLVTPGHSPCYNCWRLHRASEDYEELNSSLTAASYGPLNALSSAIATNEVLRHFLGLPACTQDKWALIDGGTLEATFVQARPHPDCDCGAFQREASVVVAARSSSLATLAGVYSGEREAGSLNQTILDPVVVELCLRGGQKVLDLGCGIGTVSRALASAGRTVTAIDASTEMLEILAARTAEADRARIEIRQGDVAEVSWGGEFNLILANMLLDHLAEPELLLERCRTALAPEGTLIVTLPHPFKDSGGWELRGDALEAGLSGRFVVEDYFASGRVSRTRLSDDTRSATALVTTFRRTLAQYAAMLTKAGFVIAEMHEPRTAGPVGELSPRAALAAKMPYFLVLLCRRGAV